MDNALIKNYLPLFGKDTDKRIGFFIYTVLNINKNKRTQSTDPITFTVDNPVFNFDTLENYAATEKAVVKYIRNSQFIPGKQIGQKLNAAHPEIAETIVNIILHVQKSISSNEARTKRIMKELEGNTNNDPLIKITKALVKLFYGSDAENLRVPDDLLDLLFGKGTTNKYKNYSVNSKTTIGNVPLSLLPIEFKIIPKESEKNTRYLFRSILENIDNDRSFIDSAYNNLVKSVYDKVSAKAGAKLDFDKFLYMIYYLAKQSNKDTIHRKALFTFDYKDIINDKITLLLFDTSPGKTAGTVYDNIRTLAGSDFTGSDYIYNSNTNMIPNLNAMTAKLATSKIIASLDDNSSTVFNNTALEFNSNFPAAASSTANSIGISLNITKLGNKAFNTIITAITPQTGNNDLLYILLYNILQSLQITNSADVLESTIEDIIYLIDITNILNQNLTKPKIDLSNYSNMKETSTGVPAYAITDTQDFILQYLGKTLNYELVAQRFDKQEFNLRNVELEVDTNSDIYQPLKMRVHKALNYFFVNEYYSMNEPSGYNLREYILNLFDEQSTITLSDHDNIDSFFNVDEGNNLQAQLYYRKDKKLYKRVDGKEIEVDYKYAKAELSKDMCAPAGLKSGDELKCTEYVSKCLQGTDIKQCQDFLNNDNTIFIAATEVDNMPPALIRKTIDILHLPYYDDVDPRTKLSVKRLKQFPDWIKQLEKSHFSKDECTKIENHKTLRTYIEAIIVKANTEYAILNDNYGMQITNEIKDHFREEALKGTKLYRYGLKPIAMIGGSEIEFSIDQLENLIHDSNVQLMNSINFNLKGGSPIDYDLQFKDSTKRTGSILSAHFVKLQQILTSKGKKISPETMINIEKRIKSLTDSENTLIRTNYFIREYINLINSVGEEDTLGDVLRMENIQKFVEARKTKASSVIGKREKILTVLRSLKDLV